MNLFDKIYWAIPYSIKDKYYSIRDFFNPRQKWLTKKIPRTFSDKVWLIQLVAFESIIHFVEEEEAFERIEWSSTPEHEEAGKAFTKAYQLAKLTIPILEKKRKKLWENKDLQAYFDNRFLIPVENQEGTKNKRYQIAKPTMEAGEVLDQIRDLDKEIEEKTQEVVEIVAKYRNYMWT